MYVHGLVKITTVGDAVATAPYCTCGYDLGGFWLIYLIQLHASLSFFLFFPSNFVISLTSFIFFPSNFVINLTSFIFSHFPRYHVLLLEVILLINEHLVLRWCTIMLLKQNTSHFQLIMWVMPIVYLPNETCWSVVHSEGDFFVYYGICSIYIMFHLNLASNNCTALLSVFWRTLRWRIRIRSLNLDRSNSNCFYSGFNLLRCWVTWLGRYEKDAGVTDDPS